MADCERALGHPEKAIELSRSAEAADLDPASTAELLIVVAGARADLGQLDAAIANLEVALNPGKVEPYSARLFYAYADLLLQADRRTEAIDFFMKAAEIDVDEETDAGDRLNELAGVTVNAEEDDEDEEDKDGVDANRADDEAALAEVVELPGSQEQLAVEPAGVVNPEWALNDISMEDEQEVARTGANGTGAVEVAGTAEDIDSTRETEIAAKGRLEAEEAPHHGQEPAVGAPAEPSQAEEELPAQPGQDGSSLPVRPANRPASMGSLFSDNERGL